MSTPAEQSLTFGTLAKGIAQWVRHELPQALLMSGVAAAVGWVANLYIMAFRYQGFVPSTEVRYATATAQGQLVTGSIFWGSLSTLVFGLFTYGRAVGWSRVLSDIGALPGRLRDAFASGQRNQTFALLAWAAAVALLLSQFIGPAASGVAAAFTVAFAASPLPALFAGVLRGLWMSALRVVAPASNPPAGAAATILTAAGTAVGLGTAFLVASRVASLLALILAIGLAVLLVRQDDAPPTATAGLLLFLGFLTARELLAPGSASADDGGWSEYCFSQSGGLFSCNPIGYILSDGAGEVVIRSTVGGIAAGVGAPLGGGLGSVLGTLAPPSGGTPAPISPDPSAAGGGDASPTPNATISPDPSAAGGGDASPTPNATISPDPSAAGGGDAGPTPNAAISPDPSAAGGGGTPAPASPAGTSPPVFHGSGSTRTVYLEGDEAQAALDAGSGHVIPIPDDQQHDLDVRDEHGNPVAQDGFVGTAGRVTEVSAVAESDDRLVVAVEVETGVMQDAPPPVAAPPPPPPPAAAPPAPTPPGPDVVAPEPADATLPTTPEPTPTTEAGPPPADAAEPDPPAPGPVEPETPTSGPPPAARPEDVPDLAPAPQSPPTPTPVPPAGAGAPAPTEPPSPAEPADDQSGQADVTARVDQLHGVLERQSLFDSASRDELRGFLNGQRDSVELPGIGGSLVETPVMDLVVEDYQSNADGSVRIAMSHEGSNFHVDVKVVDGKLWADAGTVDGSISTGNAYATTLDLAISGGLDRANELFTSGGRVLTGIELTDGGALRVTAAAPD